MSMTFTGYFTNGDFTRAEFTANLRIRVNEVVKDALTDPEFATLIATGLAELGKIGFNPGYAEVALDGSEYYELPAGIGEINGVVYKLDYTSLELVPSNDEDFVYEYNTYLKLGNKIYVNQNLTSGTLRVYCSMRPTKPATAETPIDLPYEYLETLYAYCEWQYWKIRRVPDESQLARGIYKELLEEAKEDLLVKYDRGFSIHG